MSIMLQLPYPPSANRLWVRARKGMRKSDAYSAWLTEAGYIAKSQHQKPLSGPYKLSIHAKRPDKRRRDIDNLIKPLNDLLQSIGLIADDTDCEMVCARWITSGLEKITILVQPASVEDQP